MKQQRRKKFYVGLLKLPVETARSSRKDWGPFVLLDTLRRSHPDIEYRWLHWKNHRQRRPTTPDVLWLTYARGHIYGQNGEIPKPTTARLIVHDRMAQTSRTCPSGRLDPKQLQIDAKNRKIYWSDREGMRSHAREFDGRNIETLVETGSWRADRFRARNGALGIRVLM